VTEFQLRLEEVGLEPVDAGRVESVGKEGFGRRASDATARGDDLFVLLFDDGIATLG
jgi:hypothetical protein